VRRLILAAVAALALAAPAAAKDLVPAQLRGNWCGGLDDPHYARTTKPCRAAEDVTSMTVTADEVYYHADDGTTYGRCGVLMVDKYKSWGKARPEYVVRLKCGDADAELYWLYLTSGKDLFYDKFRGGGYR